MFFALDVAIHLAIVYFSTEIGGRIGEMHAFMDNTRRERSLRPTNECVDAQYTSLAILSGRKVFELDD